VATVYALLKNGTDDSSVYLPHRDATADKSTFVTAAGSPNPQKISFR
jgi:hypothetical protein